MPAATPTPTPRETSTRGKQPGVVLGHWHGIPVSAHWSSLGALALFTYVLAASVLPVSRPHHSHTEYWVTGAVTATVFLTTVLVHELAHAAAARHYRMPIKSVTLWALGGMTELDGEPPTPRAEGLIALAGPAATIALGGGFAIASTWANPTGLVSAALTWLGIVSIVVGVFNLLPASPLDGGRVLRAILWHRFGDRSRAVAATARTGQALGVFLVVFGMMTMLGGNSAGLWLAFIGWFVVAGAQGDRLALTTQHLHGLYARDVMTAVRTVAPQWWTVQTFLDGLDPEQAAQGVFPIVDLDAHATGAITLRDLQRRPAGHPGRDARIGDIAAARRPQPLLVPPDMPLAELAVRLRMHANVGVVVAADRRPIGVITDRELVNAAHLAELGWTAHPATA